MDSPTKKPMVLVVDDEPEIRKLIGAMLERIGYDSILAGSGEEAVRIFKKQPDAIDLLLADVVTPGMAGPVLADRLTAIQPDLRVLFMSGYDSTHVTQTYVLNQGFLLLRKPMTLDSLREKVQEAIRGRVFRA